ncbi:MAG: SDR family oxidoreductase [Dehalococcoidia bacterium]|jgi:NAD(P)-dependent dehydrogenase (short-subunit alcohol dehydrogenase family)
MRSFNDNVLLITGAASGIGQATAIEFARQGVRSIVLTDINSEGLTKTSKNLTDMGCQTLSIKADIANLDEVKAMVDKAIERFGKIDILTNVAGIAIMGAMGELEIADWRRVLDVNLMSIIYTCHFVYPHMLKQKSGHIINIASLGGLLAFHPYLASYNASKFGAVGFSEALMQEALPRNIFVTCVCPGAVSTPIYAQAAVRGFRPEVKGQYSEHLLKLAETPEKTARAIVKAASRKQFLLITTFTGNLGYYFKCFFPYLWWPLLRHRAWGWDKYFSPYKL